MIPCLSSERLTLNAFTFDDIALVEKFAGDPLVAVTTLLIPHPYPKGAAAKWIATHQSLFLENKNVVFAIRDTDNNLIGAINLALNLPHKTAEIGYWIGPPHWGKGYCTEATKKIIQFGFETYDLNKIHAHHIASNPSSGRVMQKSGMSQEGYKKRHLIKNGVIEDVVEYAILKDPFST